jgi:hypothetical protein
VPLGRFSSRAFTVFTAEFLSELFPNITNVRRDTGIIQQFDFIWGTFPLLAVYANAR